MNYPLMTFGTGLLATGLSKLFRIYLCNNSSVKKFDIFDAIPGVILFLLLRLQGTSFVLCLLGSLLVSYAYVLGVSSILKCCPKYFTYGEAVVTVQALLTFLFSASVNIAHSFEIIINGDLEVATIIMQVGLVGVMIISFGLWNIHTLRSTVGFYSLCFGVLGSIVILPLHIILGASPVLWIIELLFTNTTTAMRLLNIPPLSDSLQKGFEMYADEKDAGGGALTPIYLLTGVSLPLWLHPATPEVAGNIYLPAALLAGLLAVGIGDTAASAFGSWMGRHHWPNSEKTIEGTVACILCQIAVVVCLMKLGYLQGSVPSVLKLIVAVVVTSLLEAKTDQVDNLVLPLVMYCILL